MHNLLFPLRRRGLETIDITSQKRGIEAKLLGKATHVNFRMRKEKVLETSGLGIGILETLETDVLVKFMPMNADGTDFVLGSLFRSLLYHKSD